MRPWYTFINGGNCMLGKIIGRGRTADVYEYGEDKVIKLFKENFGSSWVEREYKINKIASDFHCPTPEVYGLETVDGQTGIVFQKLVGLNISELLQRNPFKVKKYAVKAAKAHADIHLASTDELEDQYSFFERRIVSSEYLTEDQKSLLLTRLSELPKGNNLCHGDLHPENYIVADRYYIIDWTNAYSGHAASDIARSVLMLESPAAKEHIPRHLVLISSMITKTFHNSFVKEYCYISGMTEEEILAWKPTIVAARLCENIECEREWLLNILETTLT